MLKNILLITLLFVITQAWGQPGQIDSFAERLSKNHLWQNGISPKLKLSKKATQKAVISEVLSAYKIQESGIKFLEKKDVMIKGSLPETYQAVLIEVNSQKKMILIQYKENVGWWGRIFDLKENTAN